MERAPTSWDAQAPSSSGHGRGSSRLGQLLEHLESYWTVISTPFERTQPVAIVVHKGDFPPLPDIRTSVNEALWATAGNGGDGDGTGE